MAARSELSNVAGGIVDQQQTHRLFEMCLADRQKALDSGASVGEANAAARDRWNAWAEGVLKENPDI